MALRAGKGHVRAVHVFRGARQRRSDLVSGWPAFEADKPTLLFEGRYLRQDAASPRTLYDVFPDGQSFVVIREPPSAAPNIYVVLNWTEELKRLVPRND